MCIDYEEYCVVPVSYEAPIDSNNNDYDMQTWESAVEILVRPGGYSETFTIEATGETSAPSTVYKTLYKVKKGGKIKKAIIKEVRAIYEFDGSISYYKAYV